MGHRSFGEKASTSTTSTNGKSRNVPTAPQDDKMNGLSKVTQEQRDEVDALRRKVRDQVSMKMGELLLQGYTMLNAYCDVCTGIMMEDRQGVRVCLTCESMRAELEPAPSRLIAEIPLDASDDIYENQLPESTTAQKKEPGSSVDEESIGESLERLSKLKDKARKELYKMGSERYANDVDAGDGPSTRPTKQVFKHKRHSPKVPHGGIEKALSAVSVKLNWCTERLLVTEDLEEIVMLHKAIDGAINILHAHSQHN